MSAGAGVAAVDTTGGAFRAKRPEIMFDGNFVNLFPSSDWDAFPDDDRFVMFQGLASSEIVDHVVMITNWFPELEETFANTPQ